MPMIARYSFFCLCLQLLIAIILGSEGSRFGWTEFTGTGDKSVVGPKIKPLNGTLASNIVKKPVYISITTISQRLRDVHKTVWSLLIGPVIPDRIFIFVSKEPFLLDMGITEEDIKKDSRLSYLVRYYPVTIVFTENIGPHRKLLPLLDKMWDEDCLIATFDDEPKHWLQNYLQQLIAYYLVGDGTSVITLKARRFSLCSVYPFKMLSYNGWGEGSYGMHEYFLLPTGTGGILYRPRFFHPVVFDRRYINKTKTTDDLAFRLVTMIKNVFVITGCRQTAPRTTRETGHGSALSRVCSSSPQIVRSKGALVLTQTGDQPISNNTRTQSRTLIESSSYISRRQLKDGGLFGTFNRQKGNDNSLYNAYFYLFDLGLLDLASKAQQIIEIERKLCFTTSLQAKMKFPGGNVSCMLNKCKQPLYSKDLK